MEFQKDTKQNMGQSETFPQGQFLQTKDTNSSVKKVGEFLGVRKNTSYSFLYKKTEKLVSATYLITGFLSDSEPMKWSLRQSGVSILSDIVALGNVSPRDTLLRVKKILSDIESIVSLLSVARVAGYISEMNFAILSEEYKSLSAALETKKSDWSDEGFIFARELFIATPESENAEQKKVLETKKAPEEIKDRKTITPSVAVATQNTKDITAVTHEKDVPKEQKTTPKKVERSSRRETILVLVKERGEISIKDIISHFPECGEKTIQRELAALVQENVLKKVGDRRWSRYSLV